jgi:Domain of unknown function (DUF4148)
MKSAIYAAIVASIVAAPVASFAQQNGPVTRAQVRQELAQLEKAGYNPSLSDPHYPDNVQAAEARVQAQQGTEQTSAGAWIGGTVQSGAGQNNAVGPANELNSVYFGH